MTHNRTPTRTPTVASRPPHPRHPRLSGILAALAVASAVVSARAAAPTAEQASDTTAAVLSAAVPLEEEIFGWIEEITAQGIRRAGHPANLWVEDYIVDQFKRFGLEDITKKPVPVTAWFEGETGLEVRAGGRSYDFNAYPAAFVHGSLRADAPLVKYTDGMTPEAIKGRIVVLDYLLADESAISLMAASLGVHDPAGSLYETKHQIGILGGRGRVGASAAIVNRILEGDPAGIVVVMKNYFDSPYIWGSPITRFTDPGSSMPVPVAIVSPSVGDRLDAILARGGASGVLRASAETRAVTTHNVQGYLPGASPEIIQIVSHTDSNFSGAFQDAAGISLVLAQAKYWSQVPREKRPFTLLFLLTSAHIQGSVGEQVIIRNEPDRLARTMLDIHLESPAREFAISADRKLVDLDRGEPMRVFTSMAPVLTSAVIDAVKREDVDRGIVLPADVLGGHPRSAAGHWHGAGLPVVSFIGVPVYYFGAEDGVDKVHRRNLVPMTRATIRIIESVRGQTKASLAAASDDIPKAGYDATDEAFKAGQNRSARSDAHVRFVLSFDKNGDREITGDEEKALAAAVRAKLAARGEAPNPRTTAPRGGRQPGMP